MGMAQMAYMKKAHQVRLPYCKNTFLRLSPQRKVERIGIKELKNTLKHGKMMLVLILFKCSTELKTSNI